MADNPLPVDTRSFRLRHGNHVHSVDDQGGFVASGRVFFDSTHPGGRFETDDSISVAADYVVEKRMYSTVDYPFWDSQPRVPVAHVVVSVPGSVVVRRAYCTACGYMVLLDDHPSRCRQPLSSDGQATADRYRRLSWIGDALHIADVRYSLLRSVPDTASLDVQAQRFTSGQAQAAYMRVGVSAGTPVVYPPLGSSDKHLSTAFEVNYFGEFRAVYVRDVLRSSLPDWSSIAHSVGSAASALFDD